MTNKPKTALCHNTCKRHWRHLTKTLLLVLCLIFASPSLAQSTDSMPHVNMGVFVEVLQNAGARLNDITSQFLGTTLAVNDFFSTLARDGFEPGKALLFILIFGMLGMLAEGTAVILSNIAPDFAPFTQESITAHQNNHSAPVGIGVNHNSALRFNRAQYICKATPDAWAIRECEPSSKQPCTIVIIGSNMKREQQVVSNFHL